MSRSVRAAILVTLLVLAFAFINNTNWFAAPSEGEPTLLAHRGLAQRFKTEGLTNESCTAASMLPPTHPYLENTLASMSASFEAGADIVEIDVHPTVDGEFAVFHDWTLECRTDGHGVTREQTMDYLRSLDVGFGYTADGGRTFPFGGRGVGLMPSLREVMHRFPERSFLINVKSNDAAEGERLADFLTDLPPSRLEQVMVYGGNRPIEALKRRLPKVKTMSRQSLQSCLLRYAAYGWTGIVPDACRSKLLFVPMNIAPWLWGWPNRFLKRMEKEDTSVFLIGPYRGGDFSTGVDTPEQLARVPDDYTGGVLTKELQLAARVLKRGGASLRQTPSMPRAELEDDDPGGWLRIVLIE